MKKIIALLLALLLVFSLAACGGEKEEKEGGKLQTDIEKDEISNPEDYASDYYFPETVLADDENVTVKITDIKTDGDWGYTLKAFFENKTDIKLTFFVDNTSVNDVMCDPFFAVEVSAGKKSNEEIAFDYDTLEEKGISEITKIEFVLTAYDSEDWSADPVLEETYTIYPLGEDAAADYVREETANELQVFDTDDCTMIITGVEPDGFWGYSLQVYLHNKSDKNLMFAVEDAAVNNMECDPFWAEEVAAGKHAVTQIYWFEEDFEEQEIETVEKIWLELRVSDADDWMADDIVNEEIEFAPF